MIRRPWDGQFHALPTASDGSGEEYIEDEYVSRRVLVCQRGVRHASRGAALSTIRGFGASAAMAICALVAVSIRYVPRQGLLRTLWSTSRSTISYADDAEGDSMEVLDPTVWDFYGGHNCYTSHGGKPLQAGTHLGGVSVSECTAVCQADSRCVGVVAQHNKKHSECHLLGEVKPSECQQRAEWDLWVRSGATTTSTTRTITRTLTTTRRGSARGGGTSSASDDRSAGASTRPVPTTTSPSTSTATPRPTLPPVWEIHPGINCFLGHGGLPVPDRPNPLDGVMALGVCQKECEASTSCKGVVVDAGVDAGGCWLHTNIELSSCITGTPFDTWLAAPPPQSTAEDDERDAETASEDLSTDRVGSEKPKVKEEWSVRTGLNCFEGHGAHHLLGIEGLQPGENEPDPLELSLDDCKVECERRKSCGGIVVQKDAHMCWPCSDVEPDNCLGGTIFDLWIRSSQTAWHSSKGNENGAPTPSPAPSAREEHAAGWDWSLHEGINCYVGTGSEGFADGFDGKLPDDCSLADCQAACESQAECAGIVVRHDEQGDVAGPCFLRSGVRPDACMLSEEYDLWQLSEGAHVSETRKQKTSGQASTSVWTTSIRASGKASSTTTRDASLQARQDSPPAEPPPQQADCPSCPNRPKRKTAPTVVVPFYERDLCKTRYTAQSLALHDKDGALGEVLLLWISKQPHSAYADGIQAVKDSLAKSGKVQLLDFSPQVNNDHKDGWYAQQVLKLKAAYHVKSEYYIILDSKNTLVRDVESSTFFTECDQARLVGTYTWGQLPQLHQEWFHRSAELLGVQEPDGGEWPASITPMVMHRETVLDMLKDIGENPDPSVMCNGPLCDMLDKGATEFTLYLMYAQAKTDFHCTHAVSHPSDWAHELSVALWRGLDSNVDEAKAVATGERFPTLFGAQHGALDSLSEEQRQEAASYLDTIYADAGLKGTVDGVDDILACIVGTD